MGANLTVRDRDGLTPIDHAMKDRPPIVEFNGNNPCEVYVWGTNSNYSLGTGNEQSRSQPELLDPFRKQGISIRQVSGVPVLFAQDLIKNYLQFEGCS